MGYFSAKNSAYCMVPICNWHILFCHLYYYLILLLYCLILVGHDNATRIFKDHYEMSLKTEWSFFYHHIPIFNYGVFSYYAYITFIIVINTMCHDEMQTKMLPAFLRKIICNNSQFTHPSSLPIHNRFLHVSVNKITSIGSLCQYDT